MRSRGTTQNRTGLPDDVPAEFLRSVSDFRFFPAATVAAATFDRPVFVSSSHPAGVGESAWDAVRRKSAAVREAVQASESCGPSTAHT